MNSFTNANPFPAVFDRFDDARHGPVSPRRQSAGVHPETRWEIIFHDLFKIHIFA